MDLLIRRNQTSLKRLLVMTKKNLINFIVVSFIISLFAGCTPRSKLLSIAQVQIQKANSPESTPIPGSTISKDVVPKIIEKKGNVLAPATPIANVPTGIPAGI